MKRSLTILYACCLSIATTTAQVIDASPTPSNNAYKAFSHLDLSLTGGTTGIGLELGTPINEYFQVRAGYSFMPHWNYDMHFRVQVGDDPTKSKSKFNRLSGLLESVTGYRVNDDVRMIGKPTYHQLKLMVDVLPFKDKRWHFTAGCFIGPKKFGEAVNSIEDMPSLLAIGIYNRLYNSVANSDIVQDPHYFEFNTISQILDEASILKELGFDLSNVTALDGLYLDPEDNFILNAYKRIANYGQMGIHVGDYTHDIVYQEDVLAEEDVYYTYDIYDDDYNLLHRAGELKTAKGDVIHHKGDIIHRKGDPYIMYPNEESMVKADFIVNNFRPYLGFGYGGNLKKDDDRWQIAFDCGVMLWGGTPQITTHDGIDLCKDVTNVRGDVGKKVRLFKKFKAFPIIELRLTRRLF